MVGDSKSRSRRLRGTATKHRLFEQAQRSSESSQKTGDMLPHLNAKIDALERLLDGKLQLLISWCVEGTFWYAGAYPSWHCWSQEGAYNNGDFYNTHSGNHPVVHGAHRSGSPGFQSLPKDAWERIYDLFQTRTEAGDGEIMCGNSDISGNTSADYDEFCSGCGKPFQLPTHEEDYDGDRCDLCGSPFHTECLRTHHDLRGEWQLCDSCIASRRRDKCHILGDFRRLPTCYWDHLYSEFNAGGTACHSEDNTLAPPSPSAVSFEELETTVNYMLKFMEGHHAKSSNLTKDVRSTILGCIKSALAWRQTSRSKDDVEKYVKMLNGVMSEIVRKL